MIKLCTLVIWAGVWVAVAAVTQEQLAQYVAAQQTASHKHQPVAVLSRPRQAYALQQAAEEAGDEAYQQAYQAAYQQAAAAYQPQSAPQATSSKYFSSSVGLSSAKNYAPVAAAAPAQGPVYYRPAPGPQYQTKLRPLPAGPGLEQEPEDYDPNPAYQFSFDVKDDEFTNYQNRKEQRDGDKISGSYSVVDSDGYIRTVTYTADPKEGFKAEVSREPTEIRVKLPQPPAALPQQYQQIPQQLVRKQQTQQYLEASSPAVPSAAHQYAVRPQQSVAYVAPQFVATPQYSAAPKAAAGLSAYTGQHRLAAPVKPKASAIGYAAQQPTAGNPILYQAYQQ